MSVQRLCTWVAQRVRDTSITHSKPQLLGPSPRGANNLSSGARYSRELSTVQATCPSEISRANLSVAEVGTLEIRTLKIGPCKELPPCPQQGILVYSLQCRGGGTIRMRGAQTMQVGLHEIRFAEIAPREIASGHVASPQVALLQVGAPKRSVLKILHVN